MLQLLDDACLGQPGDAVALFPATFNLELFDALKAACIKRELLVVPGSACSDRATNFRLCYATTDEKLKRAVDMLNEIAAELK